MTGHVLVAPLWLPQTKTKKFYFNLNVYRNAHYRTLHTMKVRYKEHMEEQIKLLPKYDQITLVFELFPGTKRLCDTSNFCCIHEKFLCDALVEFGVIPDDDYRHVCRSTYVFGNVDKNKPRMEIHLTGV